SLFYYSATLPALHSFPTRRSSDLLVVDLGRIVRPEHRRWIAVDHRVHRVVLIGAERGAGGGRQPAERKRRILWEHLSGLHGGREDRKSTRLNSSHVSISYAVFCLK